MGSIALEGVSTLDKIIRNEREIQVWCEKCRALHVFTQAELIALAEKVGPEFSLIDRRCRCRLTPGCSGWNRFDFKCGVFRPMMTQAGRDAEMVRDQRSSTS